MQFSNRKALYAGAVVLALAVLGAGYYLWSPNSEQPPETAGNTDSKPQFPARFDPVGIELGDPAAPVVVREFLDYQCPACKRFAPVIKTLIRETDYLEDGDVRVVIFDFPLRMHDNAMPAAQAARCAHRQDGFRSMHDGLFARQEQWSDKEDPVPVFRAIAADKGLDADQLEKCVREDRTLEAVRRSRQLSGKLGVRSTPTVLINNSEYSGNPDYKVFKAAVDQALTQEGG